jgi:pimeloyl-ACP methyl ester carboxylesterase
MCSGQEALSALTMCRGGARSMLSKGVVTKPSTVASILMDAVREVQAQRFDRYTFEHLTDIIDRWTEALGLYRFGLYVFDYGAPIGFRIATWHPERIVAD